MSQEILGATRYACLVDESTWGTFPGTPVYTHLPVNDYSVRFRPQNRQAAPLLGTFQRKHSRNFRGLPAGTLEAPLYGWRYAAPNTPSLAQILMDWAFLGYETAELASKSIEWAEGPDVANKRHTGLRVNGATLAGSDDAGLLSLSLDLLGQNEFGQDVVTTAQALPDSRNQLLEFEFPDATFQLAGSPIPLKSFQLRVQHGLKAEFLNARRPTLLLKTRRLVTLQMTPVKNSDAYDAYNRAASSVEFSGQIVIQGLHNGTGAASTSYARCTIALPRLAFLNADSRGAGDDILTQPLSMIALKPDSSSTDVAFTWADVA